MGNLEGTYTKATAAGTHALFSVPHFCLHLRALITEPSVLTKLECIIIYCNNIFKTKAELQILLQHLYDMLWLVNKAGNACIR